MDRGEVIKWLKIMKANLNSFSEVSNAKKIEALAEAIRLLKNEQTTDKIDCDNADCNNCINHKYCDYETSNKVNQGLNKSEIPTGSDDCVSRKAVLKIYDEWFATCNIADKKESPKAKINALSSVMPIRPKGHWIDRWDKVFLCEDKNCSVCGYLAQTKYNYCSNCGAEMESEVEE